MSDYGLRFTENHVSFFMKIVEKFLLDHRDGLKNCLIGA